MINTVQKRNGTTQAWDVSKIRFAIGEACVGLDVDPIVLESKVSANFVEGVSTCKIQEYLVETAKQLISVEQPDWVKVSGRLLMMNIWKETVNHRGYAYGEYLQHLILMEETGYYTDEVLKIYKREELLEASTWIVQERDLDFDFAGVVSLQDKYLVKVKDTKDKLVVELPQEAILTVALLLASKEKPTNRLRFAHQLYDAISLRKISLATPLLANLRRPGGNASSCFTLSVGDSSESITGAWTDAAMISRAGGGVGLSLSKIRALGSNLKKVKGLSGGVLPFVKVFNDIANAFNQGKLCTAP